MSKEDSKKWGKSILITELFVLVIFFFELGFSIYGQGFRHYFRDTWLLIDALIIIISLVLIVMELIFYNNTTSLYSNISSVLKAVFRFFRVFLVIRKATNFKKIKSSSVV